MDRVIDTITMLDDDEFAEKKRHMAYTQGIFEADRKLGFRRRKRAGFCFSAKVKSAFPSDYYTGFRGIEIILKVKVLATAVEYRLSNHQINDFYP